MDLSIWMAERKRTFLSIAIGTTSWLLALVVAWKAWPEVASMPAASDRLTYAAELLVAVAAIVLAMVTFCFRVFDTAQAENPFANAESAAWRVHQRVLQNTLEQSVIFILALLGLAVRVHPADVRILPILTALWCGGRILFWLGYRIGWQWRGPGFEWTLYSSVLALGWFVWTFVP
jgi:hypothetical protein